MSTENYESLYNINEFNINDVMKDLDKIIGDNNIFNQVNNTLIMYHKMEDISMPINKYNSSEISSENNKNKNINETKKMNQVEAINIIKNLMIESIEKTPLISDSTNINELLNDYKKDSPLLNSVNQLINKYKSFRKTRKDGNSFYTCFIYRLFEFICINQNKTLFDKVSKIIQDSSNLIIRNGYDWETLKELYDMFFGGFKTCFSKAIISQDEARIFLDNIFQSNDIYNYFNYYIRNCVAAFIKDNQLFYENFISQDFTTWLMNVTEAGREVGQIEILACVNLFDIGVKIEYLYENKLDTEKYPDCAEDKDIFINLIIRGEHYDLLYSE